MGAGLCKAGGGAGRAGSRVALERRRGLLVGGARAASLWPGAGRGWRPRRAGTIEHVRGGGRVPFPRRGRALAAAGPGPHSPPGGPGEGRASARVRGGARGTFRGAVRLGEGRGEGEGAGPGGGAGKGEAPADNGAYVCLREWDGAAAAAAAWGRRCAAAAAGPCPGPPGLSAAARDRSPRPRLPLPGSGPG